MNYANFNQIASPKYQIYINEFYNTFRLKSFSYNIEFVDKLIQRMVKEGVDFEDFILDAASNSSYSEGKYDYYGFLVGLNKILERNPLTNLHPSSIAKDLPNQIKTIRQQNSNTSENFFNYGFIIDSLNREVNQQENI